jgi:hypothetical protein
MGPQTVDNVVAAYGKRAGIKARTHDFRHAKAPLLLNRACSPCSRAARMRSAPTASS